MAFHFLFPRQANLGRKDMHATFIAQHPCYNNDPNAVHHSRSLKNIGLQVVTVLFGANAFKDKLSLQHSAGFNFVPNNLHAAVHV